MNYLIISSGPSPRELGQHNRKGPEFIYNQEFSTRQYSSTLFGVCVLLLQLCRYNNSNYGFWISLKNLYYIHYFFISARIKRVHCLLSGFWITGFSKVRCSKYSNIFYLRWEIRTLWCFNGFVRNKSSKSIFWTLAPSKII